MQQSDSSNEPRILGFVEDPGAANMFVGLPSRIPIEIVAVEQAARLLGARGVPTVGQPSRPLEEYDLVAVGTGENIDTPAFDFIARARAAGIPSVSIIDFLSNSEFRFRGRTDDPLHHAPDTILVPDEPTRQSFLKLGCPEEQVIVTGHPQYDFVLNREAEFEDRETIRRRLFPEAEGSKVAIFLGEPAKGLNPSQFQRNDAYSLDGHPDRSGRTLVVLDEIFEIPFVKNREWYFVYRPHPRQTPEEITHGESLFDRTILDGDPLELVYAADVVLGMTTMLLQEAAILGRPTLSIVPRQSESAWLPNIVSGHTKCVWTQEGLAESLPKIFDLPAVRFPVERGGADRIADEIMKRVGRRCG